MNDVNAGSLDETLRLLGLHAAGSPDMRGDWLADRIDRWRRSEAALEIEEAVNDIIRVLSHLEGLCSDWQRSGVPPAVADPVSEILERLAAVPIYDPNHPDLDLVHRCTFRVATAWTALMTGDVEDLIDHVRWEEVARFT